MLTTLFVIIFIAYGIMVISFYDEIDSLPHPKSSTGKLDGLIDFFYIFVLFICGFIVVGCKIVNFLKKKFNKTITLESAEEDYEEDIDISMSNIKKLIAFTIIGLFLILILIPVIFIIFG